MFHEVQCIQARNGLNEASCIPFAEHRISMEVVSTQSVHGITHKLPSSLLFKLMSNRYIRTNILPKEIFDHVQISGVDFAEAEDAGRCLLRILSDKSINGRSLFVSPRKWAPRGYLDLDLEGYSSALEEEIQEDQMKSAPPALGLFPH